jgi:tripartite-type tricarboxylate transporter receptor subunit TctC
MGSFGSTRPDRNIEESRQNDDRGRCLFARRDALTSALLAVFLLCTGAAETEAQDAYPSKPVRIVVGMPAGTFTDLTARLIGDELRASLGGSFIVENRPGAATNIATASVARSPNDGYTLLLSSNSNTMNVSLFKQLPFDIVKDFVPVAMIAASSFILVVSPALPVTTLQELIEHAKKNPGAINFASTGAGTANHLAIEMLSGRAGIKVTTVYYKGSPEAVADILAGRMHAMFTTASSAMQHIQAGTLRPLAVTSARRTELAPRIPTMAEAGLPGYEVAMWNGIFAPVGTPDDVVNRIATATRNAQTSSDLRARITTNGGDPVIMGPKDFAAYIAQDIARWAEVTKAAGITPQ